LPPVDYTIAAGYTAAQVYAFRHDQSAATAIRSLASRGIPRTLARRT
jgi:hypothetical protein